MRKRSKKKRELKIRNLIQIQFSDKNMIKSRIKTGNQTTIKTGDQNQKEAVKL